MPHAHSVRCPRAHSALWAARIGTPAPPVAACPRARLWSSLAALRSMLSITVNGRPRTLSPPVVYPRRPCPRARPRRQAHRRRKQRRDRAARAAMPQRALAAGDRSRSSARWAAADGDRRRAWSERSAQSRLPKRPHADPLRHRGTRVPLAPARRHRQVSRFRANARGHRRVRRRNRHRRDPPHQHRAGRERAVAARRAAAVGIHVPAEQRGLLYGRRRRAHAEARARAARRPRARQARGAGRPAYAVPQRAGDDQGRGDAGGRRLSGDGATRPTIRSSRASWSRSAVWRSCRSRR